jgi:hypothetical protein
MRNTMREPKRKQITHLAAVEPGWVFQYVCSSGDDSGVVTLPIISQVVVHDVEESGELDPESCLEFVVVDDGSPTLLSDFRDSFLHDNENCRGMGIVPPGVERLTAEEVRDAVKLIEAKKRKSTKIA